MLPEIERRAGERLAGHPAGALFAGHVLDVGTLAQGLARDMLWVSEAAAGELAGYLLAGELQGDFHVLQMDVLPEHGGKGHGRALLRHALAQAEARGYRAAVLSTLSDVPWNAAFYASEGFLPWSPDAWNEGMRAVMAEEAAAGFPMQLRMAMRRVL